MDLESLAAAVGGELAEGDSVDDEARGLAAERCRRSFARFVREGWHVLDPDVDLEWNWHHKAICDHVQAMFDDWRTVHRQRRKKIPVAARLAQRMRKLLINVPPGTAKSRLVSVYFPAWVWLPGNWPPFKFLCISSTPDVATRDANANKQLVESEWYRETFTPSWSLSVDEKARTRFANTAGGRRISKGMTATVTGLRSDAIIVDDPHDAKDISDVKRQSVITKWRDALSNRVNDRRYSLFIGICQRVHEDDWSNAFLGQGAAHLNVEMEFTGQPFCKCRDCTRGATPLGHRDPRERSDFRPGSSYGPATNGKVLHPTRDTLAALEDELKKGATYYATQFQQRPAPAEGGLFRKAWLRYLDAEQMPARFQRLLISVDAATKEKDHDRGSNTSLLLFGEQPPNVYLLDNVTGNYDIEYVLECIRAWHKGLSAPLPTIVDRTPIPAWWAGRGRIIATLVEDTVMGSSVVQMLRKRLSGVIPMKPRVSGGKGGGDDKVTRAMAVQPDVQAGNLILLRGAAWLEAYVHELTTFPNAAKDDQVDATTQLLNYIRGSVGLTYLLGWNEAKLRA